MSVFSSVLEGERIAIEQMNIVVNSRVAVTQFGPIALRNLRGKTNRTFKHNLGLMVCSLNASSGLGAVANTAGNTRSLQTKTLILQTVRHGHEVSRALYSSLQDWSPIRELLVHK